MARKSALLAVKPDGSPPPIFLLPGADGHSLLARRLSAAIGNRAFYTFRSIGLESAEYPITSIEDAARANVEAIRDTYSDGPLVVLGHCAGCPLAYEMAQQLAGAGRQPAALVLIDPPAHKDTLFLHFHGLELARRQAVIKGWVEEMDAEFRAIPQPTMEQRHRFVKGFNEFAAASYHPRPYVGGTLLFVTPERTSIVLDKDRGYPALLPRLETLTLAVSHLKIFSELQPICDPINAFIDKTMGVEPHAPDEQGDPRSYPADLPGSDAAGHKSIVETEARTR